jgi:predicted TIM-barrel fold metal-dependent hydrolase
VKNVGSVIKPDAQRITGAAYPGPINQSPDFSKAFPADIHVHHGGANGGGYGRRFLGSHLTEILNLTRDPRNPEHGYALAIQRVPQSSPAGTRYYLASQRDGSVISVDIKQRFNKSKGDIELTINPVKDKKGEILYPGGTFSRAELEAKMGTVINDKGLRVPALQLPKDQKLVPASFIPDFRLEYRGLIRDKALLTQIVADLEPHDQKRVFVGLTSGDPGNILNDRQIHAVLKTANELDPKGTKLRMIFGETTLAKEGVITNLNGAADLHKPKSIHNLLNFVDKVKGVIVFHVDSGTPTMLNTGRVGDFSKAILGTPSNYANVEKTLEIFAKHPNSNIVWAHAGGVGRYNLPAMDHTLRTMQRVLEGSDSQRFKHVTFDLSWDVVIKNLGKQNLLPELASLVNRHPDRFMYGSDSVGAGYKKDGTLDHARYAATMDQLVDSGFLGSLHHADMFLRGNFDRLVPPAAERLNQYRLQNKELINNYPVPVEPND